MGGLVRQALLFASCCVAPILHNIANYTPYTQLTPVSSPAVQAHEVLALEMLTLLLETSILPTPS